LHGWDGDMGWDLGGLSGGEAAPLYPDPYPRFELARLAGKKDLV
jgi:hypothetical protein